MHQFYMGTRKDIDMLNFKIAIEKPAKNLKMPVVSLLDTLNFK